MDYTKVSLVSDDGSGIGRPIVGTGIRLPMGLTDAGGDIVPARDYMAIMPVNVNMGPLSRGVIDLGTPAPKKIVAFGDFRLNTVYAAGLLLTSAPPSAVGSDLAMATPGLAFANQPANDSVTVRSDNAADVGKTVTVYGTTTGTNCLVKGVATIAAADTDYDLALPDGTAKTNWGEVLAAEVSAALDGTLTLKEKSGGLTITTLDAEAISKGVTAVANGSCYGLPVQVTQSAGGASTKKLGVIGVGPLGEEIYDCITQAAGTVNGVTGFTTVTKFLTGDAAVATQTNLEIGQVSGASTMIIVKNGVLVDSGVHGNVPADARYLHWVFVNAAGAPSAGGGLQDWLKLIIYP